ncbi:hypothetical protein ACQR1H_18545 [Bradyrhizobium sp. HKCCYLRH2015]|uniref:hypothetical protein n=2 Tax=Nitrobacteraceae TaxID=41294 RepID=UPI0028F15A53|nr:MULTISPECIES: hypothetical protein [unclassified Bradyrhizobium]
MTPVMTIVVAIGLTSAACYALLVRAGRRPHHRRSSADSTSVDSDGASSSSQGSGVASWFSNTSSDVMGNPIDGGGDSGDGGGGDGGGGD